MNVVAVIADIVDSRHIADRARFQRTLKATLNGVNKRSRRFLLSPLTLTLGDEFQAVYSRFDSLFADIIEITINIFPAAVRFAVAYGPLSTDINPIAALEMDGRAFNDAHDLLNKLKKQQRTIIQVASTELLNYSLVDICLTLFSNEMERWNRNTLLVFHALLHGLYVDDAARIASITRRAVNKAIATHHLRDYVEMLSMLTKELNSGIETEPGG